MHAKRRYFISIFTEHPVAANMLMAVMLLIGLFSLFRINTQFLPNFDLNLIQVQVVWPGANAEDVVNSITRPLEQEFKDLDYLKEMQSISRQSVATVILEFEQGTNMGDALNQVRERVSQIRNLPQAAEKPIITNIEAFETVAKLVLTGPKNIESLRTAAYRVERELLDLGIAKISLAGLPDLEISVEIPTSRLAELGLSLNQIAQQISRKSEDVPAGTIGKSQLGKQLRALQQKRTLLEFANIPLTSPTPSRLLYLKDIADIKLQPQKQEPLVYYDAKPAVIITLMRSKTSSALHSANILEQWQKQYRPKLSSAIQVQVYSQRWQLIQERINLLIKNGIGGLFLIIVILLTLLNARIAWWVIVGIPTSIFAALGILYFFGGTINMVSLFALIMTLGIIVDDTIVVSEEALTQLQKGKTVLNSVITGARKMLIPVTSSSLTTVSAFIPLLLISGTIGQILFDIPLIVICVIFASLIECFLVLPGHLYHSLKHQPQLKESNFRIKVNSYFFKFRERYFRRVVLYAIRYNAFTLTVALSLFLLAFAVVYFGLLPFNFFPSPEGRLLYANVQFTAGTKPKIVTDFTKQVAKAAQLTAKQLSPNKKIITSLVRYQNRTAKIGNSLPNYGEQFGSVELELVSPDQRAVNNQQFINTWRKNLKLPPGIENFLITTRRAGPPGVEVDIALSGNNIQQLKAASQVLMNRLRNEAGTSNVKDDIPFGQDQVVFDLNHTGRALGLSIQDVSDQLRAAFSGALAEIYYTKNDEIEVRVQLPTKERDSLSALKRFPIITPAGKLVHLETITSLRNRKGFDIIRHTDANPTIHITAEVDSRINNENRIRASLAKTILPNLTRDYDVKYRFKGRAEDQQETLQDMLYGLLLASIFIYIILAWVFGSYGWPLLVMVAIPLGLTGAIFGHLIMGINLTLLSLFGLFGLSGIVVNDSIILLSTYKRIRTEAPSIAAAIVDASCQRFRAVLLTSLTTIAGLTPLLFETSLQAQFLIPMAVSIVFGLAYATFLILIVIPTLLSVYEAGLKRYNKNQSVSAATITLSNKNSDYKT